ncbi:hypothetical protein V1478_013216 [Vespula squamosa]|uniref:Uncharacterized protein n=1 Tax=Vespula squamosa TaxID=30214 RepID=A0ABD2AAS3_VESSQ
MINLTNIYIERERVSKVTER